MSDALTTLENLRKCGWSVAVHNDYKIRKKSFTFWLMTREDGLYLKGEGATDAVALDQIVAQLRAINDEPSFGTPLTINAPPVCRKCLRCHRGACHKSTES